MDSTERSLLGLLSILIVVFSIPGHAQIVNQPIVDTINGQLIGNRGLHNGKVYEEFLSVPFAEPPVNGLRWKKSIPSGPWEGVRNATEYSIACTHFIARFYPAVGLSGENGEDCLYLNIWVPGGVKANEGRQLPVMVYIFGGVYIIGTGEQYPGYSLALHGDVIVVNFNYRLSTLGFLSTGDAELPGNYGLWDVQTALQWVQTNIASFSGDPSKVTLFGQSAGGGTVSFALISPHTNGLFQNAIAVSGASTSFSSITKQAPRIAILLGDLLNCTDIYNTRDLVNCLDEFGPYVLDFWGIIGINMATGNFPNMFPVVDGDFVPVSPSESFEQGVGKDINLITGFCHHDAAGNVIANSLASPRLNDSRSITWENETIWNYALSYLNWMENGEELFNEIIRMYPDIESPDYLTRTIEVTQAFTDWWFASQSNWEANQHARAGGSGKTYQYQFRHRQSFLVGYPDWIEGSHLDDLYSIFGTPYFEFYRRIVLQKPFDETDIEISNTIMEYYSNFAHTGNPNEGPFTPRVEWTEFNPAEQNFLLLSTPLQINSFYDDNAVDRYRFWTDDFKDMQVLPPAPTFPPITDEHRSADDFRTKRTYTEEDVQRSVAAYKDHLFSIMPDPSMWESIEAEIDEFVANRPGTF